MRTSSLPALHATRFHATRTLAFAAALAAFAALPAAAQRVPAEGQRGAAAGGQRTSVTGVVVDSATGAPLAGATVRATGTPFATVARDDGRFELRGLRPGDHLLTVDFLGYGAALRLVTLEGAGAAADLGTLRLPPQPVLLEALEVTVSRIAQRRRRHTKSVRAMEGRDLVGVAGSARNVVEQRLGVVPTRCLMAYSATDGPTSSGRCMLTRGTFRPISVVVDERPALGGLDELDLYPAHELYAVEVYPADATIRVYTKDFVERVARGRAWLRPIM